MREAVNLRKSAIVKSRFGQKTADETEPKTNEEPSRNLKHIGERGGRRNFDDAAEMFRGLFDGNEHYNSSDASFVSLFG